jgi:hemerythrin superfamily protein
MRETYRRRRIGGAMEIYDLLKDDHRLVEDLLDRLASGDEFDPELVQTIKDQLLVHSHAEDEVFYSALARRPEAATLIEESRQDHQAVEGLLEELSNASFGEDDDWTDKVDDLEALVAEHVEFEENEVIPLAERLLDDEEANDLGNRFVARKDELSATHH